MKRATLACVTCTAILSGASNAEAVQLFEFSGRVGMADGAVPAGVKARLQVDLDRNGKFSSFETLTATVGEGGTYKLSYDLSPTKVDFELVAFVTKLLADHKAKGFASLIEGGPLPAVVTFEREGYSTVVRKLSTLFENPTLDVTLAPLQGIECGQTGCQAASGSVRISGFPAETGISRGYAEAYDPSKSTPRFPGDFTDVSQNLLISSGFTEIDFRDESGKRVTTLPSPVTVRYEANRASWPTLVDLSPGTAAIEVPMYSFDETKGEWVAEKEGVLEDQNGHALPETELAAIVGSTYPGPLFIRFSTSHFSTWNCDRPVSTRTCVKGRLVDGSGNPLPGVSAQVSGVSYTGGLAATVTAADGMFASDLMKSETAGEDVDRNGKAGETFTARVSATAGAGVFAGAAFDTPATQKSIGNQPKCKPAACDCIDLGDVVVSFESPRLCEISVKVAYSGKSTTGDSPLPPGAAIANAKVRAELSGGVSVPASGAFTVCEGKPCSAGRTSADGSVSFFVPVLGDDPEINVNVAYDVQKEGTQHRFSGSASVKACAKGVAKLDAPIETSLDHISLAGLGDFLKQIKKATSGTSGGASSSGEPGKGREGCQCEAAGHGGTGLGALVGAAGAVGLFARRRRRK